MAQIVKAIGLCSGLIVVLFSAFGRTLAAQTNPVTACELSSGGTAFQELYQLGIGKIIAVDASPDQKQLVVLSASGLHILDMDTLDVIRSFNAVQGWTVAWSPDGRYLATGGSGIQIWDAVTGRLVQELHVASDTPTPAFPDETGGPRPEVLLVAWSPDGKFLAAGGSTPFRVWDVARQQVIFEQGDVGIVSLFFPPFNNIAWSPDEQYLTVATSNRTIVWEVSTWQEIKQFPSPYYSGKVSWSASGLLAMIGKKGDLQIWDTNTWIQEPLYASLVSNRDTIVQWSPDGMRLAFAGHNRQKTALVINLFDTADDTIRPLYGLTGEPTDLIWSGDGSRLVAVTDDGTIFTWDIATGELLGTRINYWYTGNVAWSPDNRWLATEFHTGSDSLNLDQFVNVVQIWDAESGALVSTLPIGQYGSTTGVVWSPDSQRLAVADMDQFPRLRVWNVGEDGSVVEAKDVNNLIYKLWWSADGRQIIGQGYDKKEDESEFQSQGRLLQVWDTHSGDFVETLEEADAQAVALPTGQGLYVFSHSDGKLRVRNADSGAELLVIPGAYLVEAVTAGLHSFVLTDLPGEEGSVQVWDIEAGKVLLTLDDHSGSLRSILRLSPQGHILAMYNLRGDQPIETSFHDVESGDLLWTFSDEQQWIQVSGWSPDESCVAVTTISFPYVSNRYSLQIRDSHTGEVVLQPDAAKSGQVMWSPDGKKMAWADLDGTVRVWGVEGW